MDALPHDQSTFAVVDDNDLQQFLGGLIEEPEERVGRKGVPDNRARYRESRAGDEIWRSAKEEILKRGRIRGKVGKFDYMQLPLSEDGNEIRLLRIHPAKNIHAELVCDLAVMDIARMKNKYEALSYCWGGGEPDRTIFIRSLRRSTGREDSVNVYRLSEREEFPVRSNLLHALQHLRSRDRPVLLWVDAICINQRQTTEATAEKNQQLSMMSDIYNSAKNVCIWLDDSDESTSEAFRLVNSVTNFHTFHKRLHEQDQTALQTAGDGWRNLVELLKGTRWFSRRWIIQEIASARSASVHCGNDRVHWDDLAVAISLLEENCAIFERHFHEKVFSEIPTLSATQLVKALTNVCRKSPTGEISERLLDFETLVCTFQQFQATYPQDVIHSVRALASDAPGQDKGNDFGLGVDDKTSTRDLFVAFVNRCIRQSRSLDIICRHWAPLVTDTADKEIALPSWISKLSNTPFGLPGHSYERQNGENFVAISPSYKWKRYNASGDWITKSGETTPAQRTPVNLSVPRSDTSAVNNRWSTGRNFPVPSFSPEVTDSPTVEQHGFFAKSTTTQELAQTDAGEQASLPLFFTSAGDTALKTPPMPYSMNRGKSPIIEPTRNQSNSRRFDETAVPTFRHKRSSTLPSNPSPMLPRPLPSVPEQKPDLWKELLNAARSPPKLRSQIEEYKDRESRRQSMGSLQINGEPKKASSHDRQGSKAKQESHVQKDKEYGRQYSGQLHVDGVKLGIVKECSDLMRDGIVPGDWLAKLGWHDGPSNSVPDQLWRLLVADRTANGGDPPEWYRRACLHCLKDSRLVYSKGDLHSHKSLPDNPLDPMTATYLKRVESIIWRRRIIQLELDAAYGAGPFFGLAPERTKVGDIVCILAGCSVPVVLKSSRSSEVPLAEGSAGVFELVGEAYVHKMMNGEAVQALGDPKDILKEFVLQ